ARLGNLFRASPPPATSAGQKKCAYLADACFGVRICCACKSGRHASFGRASPSLTDFLLRWSMCLPAFRLDANLRRCVRPTHATNIVLSALVDGTSAQNASPRTGVGVPTGARNGESESTARSDNCRLTSNPAAPTVFHPSVTF